MTHGEAPIEVVPYDPGWPVLFQQESELLRRILASCLRGSLEHIGSTAIPGLPAKPVIDILAGVSSLEASRPAIEAAATAGYCYFPYRPELEHWFCKPSAAFRTHHLHLMPIGTPQWSGPIAFREYLKAHPDVAAEYAELKRGLAVRFRLDREAYTDAKAPFINAVTDKAIESGYGPGRA